jgi:hypothetical protein
MGWSAVCKDQESRPTEAGKRAKKSPSSRQPRRINGEETEKQTAAIKQTKNREESKRMWYLIKQTVRDPQSPSDLKIQRIINGKIQEFEVQEDVKNAIQQKCDIRFSLAYSAPIMTTLLGKQLQYLSNESLAQAIITGTYKIPSDIDPATKLILEEIEKLGIKLVNEEGTKIIITPEDFQRFWNRVGEFTSSSMSGVHYGRYKAAIQCDISTKILAQQLTVVAQSGILPESWSIGLQVMLEKIAGVCLVKISVPFNYMKPISTATTNLLLGMQRWTHSTVSATCPRSFSPKKEAQVKMQSSTRLSWPTSHDKPATQ